LFFSKIFIHYSIIVPTQTGTDSYLFSFFLKFVSISIFDIKTRCAIGHYLTKYPEFFIYKILLDLEQFSCSWWTSFNLFLSNKTQPI